MSRATVVYLSMIVALVGGLWAILTLGGHLTAPEDLRGHWVAVAATAGAPAARGGWSGVTVDQSGQYFQLAFDNGPQGVAVNRVGRDADGRLSLARGKWRVTIDGPAGAEVRTFHVDGPQSGTLTARRPVPAADAPATRPATATALTPAPKEAP